MLTRRELLAGLGATLVPVAGPVFGSDETAFIACCQTADGGYGAALIDPALTVRHIEPLDARGHDVAINRSKSLAVIFARRPGRFAIVIDLHRNRRVLAFAPPPERHFYGHGFFSNDDRLLFATENDYEAERGELGIYDATNGFARIAAFKTGGTGPHEALLMRDGRTIAVANGGIATHPDYPRQKLNVATMAPSITLLDAKTGDIREMASLPTAFHQLSIRHMAEAGDGTLWFGGQYEGGQTDDVALIGRFRPGHDITLIEAPTTIYRRMNQYIGSVAISRDGAFVATTSPRGGQVIIWDAATAGIIETRQMADVCGAAPYADGFLLSDGGGGLTAPRQKRRAPLLFDNHLAGV